MPSFLNLTESLTVGKLGRFRLVFIMWSLFIKAFFIKKIYEAFFQFSQVIYHQLSYQAR